MKRFGFWAALVLLLGGLIQLGFSGAGSIYAMKAGDFTAKNFAGTQAGLSAAYVYCGNSGFVQLGPGLEGLTVPPVPSGVTVVRITKNGWETFASYTNTGTFRVIGAMIPDSIRTPNYLRTSFPGFLQADGSSGAYSKLDGYQGLTMSIAGMASMRNVGGSLLLQADAVAVGRLGFPLVDLYLDANGKFRTAGAESVGTVLTVNAKEVVHDSLRVDRGIRSNACIISDDKVLAADSLATRGTILMGNYAFSSLPSAANGTIVYCRDCTSPSSPASGSGNGALAIRQNGGWKCP